MDIKFQDRIDEFLLHVDRFSDEDKRNFLQEIEQDIEKKEQYQLTKNIKDAISSREVKLKVMSDFKRQYDKERTDVASTGMRPMKPKSSNINFWWWVSAIAAMVVVGFFAFSPIYYMYEGTPCSSPPVENIRGGDEIFNMDIPVVLDSIANDTIVSDSIVVGSKHE